MKVSGLLFCCWQNTASVSVLISLRCRLTAGRVTAVNTYGRSYLRPFLLTAYVPRVLFMKEIFKVCSKYVMKQFCFCTAPLFVSVLFYFVLLPRGLLTCDVLFFIKMYIIKVPEHAHLVSTECAHVGE